LDAHNNLYSVNRLPSDIADVEFMPNKPVDGDKKGFLCGKPEMMNGTNTRTLCDECEAITQKEEKKEKAEKPSKKKPRLANDRRKEKSRKNP
jgi:hypothetical protein